MSTNETTAGSEQSPDRQRHPLARGIELLTLMVDTGEDSYGVRELASLMGVSASTAHRLLGDLEKLGMVGRTRDGAYRLGLEFLRLAWATTARLPLEEAATDILGQLTERTGESSFFGVYNEQRQQMMFTHTVESPHPLRYVLPMHTWLPLHAGASGLAILAFLPDETRHEIVHGPLPALTARTRVDPGKLSDRLDEIRRDGYAISHGERIEGAISVAAPVFGLSGTIVVGDIGITIPESRFNLGTESELVRLVKDSAAALTDRIASSRVAIRPQPNKVQSNGVA
ncbi:IclR family transcriptional regulator [Micrococcaceae bacterium Sec5.1]|uniref:IclR family transcriptional regulator n=1 Tax=Paenarthrobacter sp. 2TAF44 TaxID=3233018 RepID=UPI00336703AB